MKRILFIVLAVICCASVQLSAQKIGYINTEAILSHLSEYHVAQEKLEVINNQYKEKVESEFKVVEQMYNRYMSAKSGMTEAQRSQQENAIIDKEKRAKELRNAYFGQDGYFQKKSEELLLPIKDKVQQAIDKIAKDENFMIIFDVAIMQGVVYDNPQYDLSTRVLELLNIR